MVSVETRQVYEDSLKNATSKRFDVNPFYLSLDSLVFGITSYLTSSANNLTISLLSTLGILISLVWLQNVFASREIDGFRVIHELEDHLPPSPKYYIDYETMSFEQFCPITFLILFFALLLLTL